MNDIEKKIEELKSEFLTKLEELKKEAEMQKKQEEWKFGEKYFYISQSGRVICEMFTEHRTDIARKNFGNFFRTRGRAEQVADKMRLRYGLSSCMTSFVRIMCRTGETMDKSFLFILIMQKTAGI